MSGFHEILFPLDIALRSAGGPQRRTDIVALGSGREERNARWAHSRRRYDAGYGVKTLDSLSEAVAFFEAHEELRTIDEDSNAKFDELGERYRSALRG